MIWYSRWEICKSITPWTHPWNSKAAAEAQSLKTSSYGKSLKWSQRPSQSTRDSKLSVPCTFNNTVILPSQRMRRKLEK